MNELSVSERKALAKAESVIEHLRHAAIEAAKALRTIRDQRLYRATHENFDDYCRQRWGFERQYGHRLCAWAEVAENLSPIGDIPMLESHARPLARLTADQQREAWQIATEADEITAEVVEEAAAEVLGTALPGDMERPDIAPLVPWYGGKWKLAPRIVSLLPPHSTYIEPFLGSGAVLLTKEPSRAELVNDVDGDVVNLFRVLRNVEKGMRLQKLLKLTPYARDEFEWCRANPENDDPVEKARRFVVRCRQSYAGIVDDPWACTAVAQKSAGFVAAVNGLENLIERLRRVQVENIDFRQLLAKCDRRGNVIYCDPPYPPEVRFKAEGYRHEMTADDHDDLLDIITGYRRANVIVSGYRCGQYDRMLKGWQRYEVQVRKGCARIEKGERKPGRVEIIWCNF